MQAAPAIKNNPNAKAPFRPNFCVPIRKVINAAAGNPTKLLMMLFIQKSPPKDWTA